eukprot:TRINITY_DN24852_c0_g1_i1.p1 TRINITY_DN24852_c0_g1~~TRINITY_DN24852_c0_g1_i1.p1  ORF type:complete len:298 (-),score=40.68 TRINITY_DN24852_c0_g1_i1:193-1086(-)
MGVAASGSCPTSDVTTNVMVPVQGWQAAHCDKWHPNCEAMSSDGQVRAAWFSQEAWVNVAAYDDDVEVQIHEPLQLNWRMYTDVIPPGWFKVDDCEVPMCCMLPFGAACIIQERKAPRLSRRVLLAMPTWAADKKRARWLARSNAGLPVVTNITRTIVSDEDDLIFVEFEYPSGESLDVWLRNHQKMPEAIARRLCFDLLNTLVSCRSSPIRFRGLLTLDAVYVSGSGCLIKVLPVGAVLSYLGVKTSLPLVAKVGDEVLPPEMEQAIEKGNRMVVLSDEMASISDLYSARRLCCMR